MAGNGNSRTNPKVNLVNLAWLEREYEKDFDGIFLRESPALSLDWTDDAVRKVLLQGREGGTRGGEEREERACGCGNSQFYRFRTKLSTV